MLNCHFLVSNNPLSTSYPLRPSNRQINVWLIFFLMIIGTNCVKSVETSTGSNFVLAQLQSCIHFLLKKRLLNLHSIFIIETYFSILEYCIPFCYTSHYIKQLLPNRFNILCRFQDQPREVFRLPSKHPLKMGKLNRWSAITLNVDKKHVCCPNHTGALVLQCRMT